MEQYGLFKSEAEKKSEPYVPPRIRDGQKHRDNIQKYFAPFLFGTDLDWAWMTGSNVHERYETADYRNWEMGAHLTRKTGFAIKLFRKKEPSQYIMCSVWCRNKKKIDRYPVINPPHEYKDDPDTLIKRTMEDYAGPNNLHFCVLGLNYNKVTMFWMDRYTNIPKEFLTTYRRYNKPDQVGVNSKAKLKMFCPVGNKGHDLVKKIQELIGIQYGN